MLSLRRGCSALAWGALAAVPLAARAQRVAARGTSRRRRHPAARRRTPLHLVTRARTFAIARSRRPARSGASLGSFGRRRRGRGDDAALDRELPVAIDLLGRGGRRRAARRTSRSRSRRAGHRRAGRRTVRVRAAQRARSVRASSPRSTTPRARCRACGRSSTRCSPPTGSARRSGPRSPGSPSRGTRRAPPTAEAHARRVPVRLLFPLVFLVLPAFVLLTVVPGLAAGLARL